MVACWDSVLSHDQGDVGLRLIHQLCHGIRILFCILIDWLGGVFYKLHAGQKGGPR